LFFRIKSIHFPWEKEKRKKETQISETIKSKNLVCNPEKSLSQAPKTANETFLKKLYIYKKKDIPNKKYKS
jgi:hypothetical protein